MNHNSKTKNTRGPDGKCKRCGEKDVPPTLYRLPELIEGIRNGAEVWFCEGEKDADAVFERRGKRNIVVTSTMNGADDWNAEYRDQLAGAASIVIVAHNDTKLATGTNPGYRGAWKRYVSLSEFSSVSVKRAAEGNDAFDHFANDHELDDFVSVSPEELAQYANPDTPTASLAGEFEYTQPEYADRFVALYGDRFRYITAEECWLYYDEGRWREDQYDTAFHFAETLCREILNETPRIGDDGKRNPNYQAAKDRTSVGNIGAICRIARNRRPVVTTREKFDSDPFLLNLANGTYDLRARELRGYDQSDMITKLIPYRYDPEANGPDFDEYFAEVQPDEHWREQILRDLGYSITGKYGEFVFVHVGSGGNGKTTLLKLVSRIFHDYATAASWKILSNKAEDTHETILAELEGKRFGIVQMGGRALSSEQLRTIVAEPDFKARRMRSDSRTIEATHTLHVAQNDPPPMKQLDASTRRRIVVIEWTTVIEDQDDTLPDKLIACGDYVLTRIIEAYYRFNRHEIDKTATEAYFEKNRVYAWIAEALEPDANSWISTDVLYEAYKEWSESFGEKAESSTSLGRTLTALGSLRDRKSEGGRKLVMRSGFRFR
jgi:putative DNA primase/helicase